MGVFHLTEQRQQKHFYEVKKDLNTITVRDKINVDEYDRLNNTLLEKHYPRLTKKGLFKWSEHQLARPGRMNRRYTMRKHK